MHNAVVGVKGAPSRVGDAFVSAKDATKSAFSSIKQSRVGGAFFSAKEAAKSMFSSVKPSRVRDAFLRAKGRFATRTQSPATQGTGRELI